MMNPIHGWIVVATQCLDEIFSGTVKKQDEF